MVAASEAVRTTDWAVVKTPPAGLAVTVGARVSMLRALLHYHLGSPVMRTRQVMLDVQSLSANPSSP